MKKLSVAVVIMICVGIIVYEFSISPILSITDAIGIAVALRLFKKINRMGR